MIYGDTKKIKIIHGNTEEYIEYINDGDCPIKDNYIKIQSGIYIVEKTLYDFVNKIKILYCSRNYDLNISNASDNNHELTNIYNYLPKGNSIENYIRKRAVQTANKLLIIKEVKALFNLGLKEAKEMVDKTM